MTEEKVKHREWVKNAAIIFLSVLLVLTFFSNTILNRTLPEVATKQITSGNIVAQVRVSGTVVAEGAYEVKAGQTREIRTVLAKVGNTVNAGDVLFVLGEGESAEIEAAQEQLHTLELSYQRAAIGMQNYDYSVRESELSSAAAELAEAKKNEQNAYEAMEAHLGAGTPTDVTSDDIKNASDKLEAAQTALENLKNERDQAIKAAEDKMNAAYNKVDTIETYLKEQENAASATPPSTETQEPVTTPDEGEAGDSGEGETTQPDTPTVPTPEATASPLYTEADLAAAKAELETLKAEYVTLIDNPDPAIAAAEESVAKASAEYNNIINNQLSDVYVQAWKAAKDKRAAAELNYKSIESSLSQQKTSDNKSAALAWLELNEIKNQIDIQKAKIAELSGGEENVITANVSGIIQSVSITAGNTAAKGDVICTIEVPDLGYSLDATVTSEQARRLHIGDSATVSNYYWGREIIATIKTIQNDPKNPQQNKIISFSVTGDVSAGTELKLSVGSKSANYDTILPNSAIRSDSNGSFVLVIQEKSSPLGNRYIAVRQPVEVLASDDENSAVTGGVESGDFVITTSSKPVNAGDQVRMAD